jgi:hypothetical protein
MDLDKSASQLESWMLPAAAGSRMLARLAGPTVPFHWILEWENPSGPPCPTDND